MLEWGRAFSLLAERMIKNTKKREREFK
jgi:hypothetical protein